MSLLVARTGPPAMSAVRSRMDPKRTFRPPKIFRWTNPGGFQGLSSGDYTAAWMILEGGYEAAQVHHASWRRGDSIAAGGTGAAAGDGVPSHRNIRVLRSHGGRLLTGPQTNRLRRGRKRRDRISLGGEPRNPPMPNTVAEPNQLP